jgi:transposase
LAGLRGGTPQGRIQKVRNGVELGHDDRQLLNGVLWIARTGSQWHALPRVFGPKSTVQARFQEWGEHGCWQCAWVVVLQAYDQEVGLAWNWQAADGCVVKAPLGKKGRQARPNRREPTPPTVPNVAPNATY